MRAHELDIGGMTDQEVLSRMLDDDELFAEMALHISHNNKIIPFVYNDPQRMLAAACAQSYKETGRVRMIVLKARQMGLSTAIQGRGFKRVITTSEYKMDVISHDDASAEHILGMSKLFHQKLPIQL